MMIKTATVYMDKLQAVSLPKELILELKKKGWSHKEDAFWVYNEKTGTLQLVRAERVLERMFVDAIETGLRENNKGH
ncbi:hypothetical protein KKE92_01325 [Candidatus Micrarchaeota archaeon]|nr:hypothetical protein [Candidatus Micrarchaeota archaeon]MBU1681793.1 hypothetical protein [Candidatus Micrarchaeota archaeon]